MLLYSVNCTGPMIGGMDWGNFTSYNHSPYSPPPVFIQNYSLSLDNLPNQDLSLDLSLVGLQTLSPHKVISCLSLSPHKIIGSIYHRCCSSILYIALGTDYVCPCKMLLTGVP